MQKSEGLRSIVLCGDYVKHWSGQCFLFIVINKHNFQKSLGTFMGASVLDMHDTRALDCHP